MHPVLEHLTTTSPWLLVALLLTGLLLWLAGHKLLRGGTLVAGVLVGAALVAAIIPTDASAGWLLVWLLLGAAVGAALAWVMFRITTGTAMAAALVVVLCVGYSTWQSLPAPVLFEQAAADNAQARTGDAGRLSQQNADPFAAAPLAIADDGRPAEAQYALAPLSQYERSAVEQYQQTPAGPPAAVLDSMKFDWQLPVKTIEDAGRDTMSSVVTHAAAHESFVHAATTHLGDWGKSTLQLTGEAAINLGRWWLDLNLTHQVALVLVAGLAAVLGMLLGIAMPYTAAAAETSLVGAAVAIPAAIGLSYFFMQQLPGFMPQTATAWVFTLAGATLAGTAAQYWLWQRQRAEPEAEE